MDTVVKILIGLCGLLLVFLGLLTTFFVKYKPSHRPSSRISNTRTTTTNVGVGTRGGIGSRSVAGSSNRSRMAARWAHMEDGSRRDRNQNTSNYSDPFETSRLPATSPSSQVNNVYDSIIDPESSFHHDHHDHNNHLPAQISDDFGGLPTFLNRSNDPDHPSSNHPRSLHGSLSSGLVGEGPNGTRTFLRGWFGLDEPSSAGYNTKGSEQGTLTAKEKMMNGVGGGEVLEMRSNNDYDSRTIDRYQPHHQHQNNTIISHHRLPTNEEDLDWESHSQYSNS